MRDPWITYRFRKYMAGPKRWPWKNSREQHRQYQYTFFVNGCIGALLTWPVAIWVARNAKMFAGGVPLVPLNNFVYDFVNLEPSHIARKSFRRRFGLTLFLSGIAFGYLTTSPDILNNKWNNRPDLRAFPAMVADDGSDIAQKTALEAHYQSYRNKKYQ
jgi:hypothetical protein